MSLVAISSYTLKHLIDFSSSIRNSSKRARDAHMVSCFCFAFYLVKVKITGGYLSARVWFRLAFSAISMRLKCGVHSTKCSSHQNGIINIAWCSFVKVFRKHLLNLFRLNNMYSMLNHRPSTDNNNRKQQHRRQQKSPTNMYSPHT